MNPWTTKSTKEIYKNKWIRVREDQVVDPTGREGLYGVVDQLNAVFIIIVDNKKKIILTRNSRYTTGKTSWELPGGGIPNSETKPETQVLIEAEEETGIKLNQTDIKLIGSFYPANGFSSGLDYVFEANIKSSAILFKGHTEEGIDKVQAFSLTKIQDMLRNGQIHDGVTIAALCLYLNSGA